MRRSSREENVALMKSSAECGLPSSAVSVALFSLEMKRAVKQLPGKMFVKNL